MALDLDFVADHMVPIYDLAEVYCKKLYNRAHFKPRYEYYKFLKPEEGYAVCILMVISEELGVGTPWFPLRRYERKLKYNIRADGFVMHDEHERLSYTFKPIIEDLIDDILAKKKASLQATAPAEASASEAPAPASEAPAPASEAPAEAEATEARPATETTST